MKHRTLHLRKTSKIFRRCKTFFFFAHFTFYLVFLRKHTDTQTPATHTVNGDRRVCLRDVTSHDRSRDHEAVGNLPFKLFRRLGILWNSTGNHVGKRSRFIFVWLPPPGEGHPTIRNAYDEKFSSSHPRRRNLFHELIHRKRFPSRVGKLLRNKAAPESGEVATHLLLDICVAQGHFGSGLVRTGFT